MLYNDQLIKKIFPSYANDLKKLTDEKNVGFQCIKLLNEKGVYGLEAMTAATRISIIIRTLYYLGEKSTIATVVNALNLPETIAAFENNTYSSRKIPVVNFFQDLRDVIQAGGYDTIPIRVEPFFKKMSEDEMGSYLFPLFGLFILTNESKLLNETTLESYEIDFDQLLSECLNKIIDNRSTKLFNDFDFCDECDDDCKSIFTLYKENLFNGYRIFDQFNNENTLITVQEIIQVFSDSQYEKVSPETSVFEMGIGSYSI